MKYLLSTGEVTSKIEYYILDLFRLHLNIYPGDIPGNREIGFNFIFNDVKKDEIVSEINLRVSNLSEKIKRRVNSSKYNIVVDSIEVIDESKVRLTITVNEITDNITLDIYEK